MNSINDLVLDLCPDGVEFKELISLCKPIKTGEQRNRDTLSKSRLNQNRYPVINGGLSPSGFTDEFNVEANTITVSQGGASAGYVSFITENFWSGAHCYTIKPKDITILDNRYLYFFVKESERLLMSRAQGAGIPGLNRKSLNELKIPIPPIQVQKRISDVLDMFTQLEEQLSFELLERNKQYEFYRRQLFDSNNKRIKLSEVCKKITTGKLNANAKDEEGAYPFFTCDAVPYKINTYAFDTEAILVSGNGSQVGHINYYNGKFNAYQRTYVLSDFSDEIDVNYLLLYLNAYLRDYIYKHSKKGSIPYITLPMLQNFEIPLPNKSEQLSISSVLSSFDKLINDNSEGLPAEISARRKQYEYYRTKLLTFKDFNR